MACPAKREALGAVRHGRQWRIPYPADFKAWTSRVSERLNALGTHLRDPWTHDWQKFARKNALYLPEAYRLYIAALITASARMKGAIYETKAAAADLFDTALRHLTALEGKKRPSTSEIEARLDGLKPTISARLLHYWPDEQVFKQVRAKRTLRALESVRQWLDAAQAVYQAEQGRQKPTADNVRPFLHRNLKHINDTGEKLPQTTDKGKRLPPGCIALARSARELRRQSIRDALIQRSAPLRGTVSRDELGRTVAHIKAGLSSGQCIAVDTREPQEGIPLRTFRNRHPKGHPQWREIVNAIYGVRQSFPGIEERPFTGKKPKRGASDSEQDTEGAE
jgi:hypothetical protein